MDRPAARSVIEGSALAKRYRIGEVDVRALDGVDVALDEGEVVVLLGPSGSGKSALLHLLGALEVRTKGEVCYRGARLPLDDDAALTRYRRHHVGFVFQLYNPISSLTARENVALVVNIADDPIEAVEALSVVGLARDALIGAVAPAPPPLFDERTRETAEARLRRARAGAARSSAELSRGRVWLDSARADRRRTGKRVASSTGSEAEDDSSASRLHEAEESVRALTNALAASEAEVPAARPVLHPARGSAGPSAGASILAPIDGSVLAVRQRAPGPIPAAPRSTGARDSEDDMDCKLAHTTFVNVFLAELGDKTQLATPTFAAESRSRWPVFIGSASALVAMSALAVVGGEATARVVPPNQLKRIAGLAFALIVAWVLWSSRGEAVG